MKHSTQKAADGKTRIIFLVLSFSSTISIMDVLGVGILNFVGPTYSIIT
ncbi:MAG: hypothetical protein ABJB85_12380 [Nitrososphaerota archaeon]